MYKSHKLKMAAPRRRTVSDSPATNEPKKQIPGPTNLKAFVRMIVLHFCKKYLLLDIRYRIGIYLIALTTGGVVFDVFPAPRSYFSEKDNLLNQYFVKLGLGWTVAVVGVFVYFSSRTYCFGDLSSVRRHSSRLLVGTAVWYMWVNVVFRHVEQTNGICTSSNHTAKYECVDAGFMWLGFDISGHCFLLIYCVLIIVEEVNIFKDWERIADAITNEEETLRKLTAEEFASLKEQFRLSNAYVKLSVIALTLLTLLWEWMLIMTIVYFHTVPQKVFGGVIGILSWYVTYQLWYNLPFSPGQPGQEMAILRSKKKK